MKELPHISSLQAFTGFLQHGYEFIHHTCRRHNTNVFAMQLLEENILCFYGIEASEVFYDPQKFECRNVVPRRTARARIDDERVQTPDGAAQGQLNEIFMSIASTARFRHLTALITHYWADESKRWRQMPSVNLHTSAQEVLCQAACAWTGIPLREEELHLRAADLYAMADAFGRSRKACKRVEAWMTEVIEQYRTSPRLQPHTALHIIALHRDNDGRLLSSRVAAAELIDILCPIVSIATFVTFAALALHEHPYCAERMRKGDIEYIDCFILEVRRLYPVASFVSARTREEFVWQGYTFPRGALVLLDIYATNHDGARWHLPEQFDPGRFYRWDEEDPFDHISQGCGIYLSGHRSAGEAMTAEVLKVTLLHLTQQVTYTVPEQDLSIDLTRMPTLPKSGFILGNVGVTEASAPASAKVSEGQKN
jgi:fatty-acid peroxygenase